MNAAAVAPAPGAGFVRALPLAFVFIWSTGFIVARYGMPHASPMLFLLTRYVLSIAVLLFWIWLSRAVWPSSGVQWRHLAVTGVFIHAGYLGGVWSAVKGGMGAGLVALIVGLQPVLTAMWVSRTAGEHRATPRQWGGLLLGLLGLVLVVWHKLHAGEVTAASFTLALLALLSITIGTLYQKRHVASADVRTSSCIQLIAAFVVTAPLALWEQGAMNWHTELIGALAWSVLGLTLGGSSLFYLLIQRGAATQVTSWLYLVPPSTALMAWFLFDEVLTSFVLLGLTLTAAGVWLVVTDNTKTTFDVTKKETKT